MGLDFQKLAKEQRDTTDNRIVKPPAPARKRRRKPVHPNSAAARKWGRRTWETR